MKPELKILDCMDKIGLNGKGIWIPDPKQDIIPEKNTVSTVAPLCTFLRIENKAKTKKHVFCSGKWVLERKKNVKSIDCLVLRHGLVS